jgi:hypothetical protein
VIGGLPAVSAVFAPAVPCLGVNEREFHALVKAIETRYAVRRVHIRSGD